MEYIVKEKHLFLILKNKLKKISKPRSALVNGAILDQFVISIETQPMSTLTTLTTGNKPTLVLSTALKVHIPVSTLPFCANAR